MNRKPDFIAIGPHKTGTTLLHSVLNEHPKVFVTPHKELQYWSEGELIPSHNIKTVLTLDHWHYQKIRRRLKLAASELLKNILKRDKEVPDLISSVSWELRYAFGQRNSCWYDSLFPHDERETGDITPQYYYLSEKRMRECYEHNSNMKIIISIREPIDRTWSMIKMVSLADQGKASKDFSRREFYQQADYAYKHWLPYQQTVQRWQEIFQNVHVAFYDELLDDCTRWYQKICTFLEIEMDDADLLNTRVNEGIEFEIPLDCQKYLFQQYGKELKEFGETHNLARWKRKYEKLSALFPDVDT